MFPTLHDLYRLAPEGILCAFGILVMLVDPFLPKRRHRISASLALVGAAAALAATAFPALYRGTAFFQLLRIDDFSVFVHAVVGAVAVLVILASSSYLDREGLQQGEYYALVLFATAGMGVMASAAELVTAFIGLEMSSISSYILASYRRDVPKSNEAAMKYFLLGSFATAFFLYGIAMVYGAGGTTKLAQIDAAASNPTLLRLGLALILVGLAFKVAAVPFQLWTPDVYEGAPTPVTALLSSAPKAAAFAVLLRILASVVHSQTLWFWALWVVAALTMTFGNLAALAQSNLKRMLAYSSIAHAGYILVAFAARNELGTAAVLFYLAAYALMKVGAFTVVSHLGGSGERRLGLSDYAGLGSRQPVVAAFLSLFLLSLLGLPVTAGFLGKFYVFNAALHSHLVWLAVLLAINSVIGAFYYLRVIVVMYMQEPEGEALPTPLPAGVALALTLAAAGTLYLGLFPGRVMDFAAQAAMLLR